MKKHKIRYESGPCAGHCSYVIIKAKSEEEAWKKAIKHIKKSGVWKYVGEHNMYYDGTCDD